MKTIEITLNGDLTSVQVPDDEQVFVYVGGRLDGQKGHAWSQAHCVEYHKPTFERYYIRGEKAIHHSLLPEPERSDVLLDIQRFITRDRLGNEQL